MVCVHSDTIQNYTQWHMCTKGASCHGLWVMTPCSEVVGYHCFGGPSYLTYFTLKMEQQSPLKWYPATSLHNVNPRDHSMTVHHCENLKSCNDASFCCSVAFFL